jgi:hypothetical protein
MGADEWPTRIDIQAHKGARKIIVTGLVAGVGYWLAVVRASE